MQVEAIERTVRDPFGRTRLVTQNRRFGGLGLQVKVGAENSGRPLVYGSEHWAIPRPMAGRTERLDTLLRVIGRPLTKMLCWPQWQVHPGNTEQVEKAEQEAKMAEQQRALAVHRAALEKTIAKLSARRDVLRTELDQVEEELKTLLSMYKLTERALGEGEESLLSPQGKSQKAKTKKSGAAKTSKNGDARGEALTLLAEAKSIKVGLTAAGLSKQTGQAVGASSQMLRKLVVAKLAKRLGRGAYVGV